jgi:DNA-binding NarL/FixJ family response regulator
VLAPEVTRRLLGAFVASGGASRELSPPRWLGELTEREREVLTQLAEGLSNAAISAALLISEGTTKSHVSKILTKMGCSSRLQAAILAREAGLGRDAG